PFGTDFRVLRAATASADLLGARLTGVDGHPMSELIDSARTLAGGLPAWRDRLASILFESPEQLHAMGLAKNAESATYSFVDTKGRTIERQLAGALTPADVPRV